MTFPDQTLCIHLYNIRVDHYYAVSMLKLPYIIMYGPIKLLHVFTVKFQYLQIPPLLPLLSISSTCNFHPSCFYRHIPVPANSNFVTLPSVSTTCKFQPHKMHYFQFPPCCLYCHIPILAISTPFTAKFHYLQIQRPHLGIPLQILVLLSAVTKGSQNLYYCFHTM